MPVKKHRCVAEIGDTGSVDPRDPKLGRVMSDVWQFTSRLARTSPRRGVHKFRSIEELNRARELWS